MVYIILMVEFKRSNLNLNDFSDQNVGFGDWFIWYQLDFFQIHILADFATVY